MTTTSLVLVSQGMHEGTILRKEIQEDFAKTQYETVTFVIIVGIMLHKLSSEIVSSALTFRLPATRLKHFCSD